LETRTNVVDLRCQPEKNIGLKSASKFLIGIRTRSRTLFFTSLAVNLLGLVSVLNIIAGRGGINYLQAYFEKNPNVNVDTLALSRSEMFRILPASPEHPIVFLGDSITLGCEWRELFGNHLLILNRGIGGDTSAGVLKRISEVARLGPAAVFLMIGTNDAQMLGYSPADTVQNYKAIVDELLHSSPKTSVYVESILPTQAPRFNRWSDEVNRRTRQFANGNTVRFIDLRPAFLGSNLVLDKRYTYDGIHLNAAGYLVWKRAIDPIMAELSKSAGWQPIR
jgi:lysophospholipase L1-like esterase